MRISSTGVARPFSDFRSGTITLGSSAINLEKPLRLLTRSDFDGLVCAALLFEKEVIDDYTFVHPKDIQDGNVTVTSNDVLANVPYAEGVGLWFDHHASEEERLELDKLDFEGASLSAPSAAQVVWDYYGGDESFGKHLLPLLEAVNKTDSGNLTREEILEPKDWILVSFVIDPRTGLGRFKDYRISNYQLMEDMIQYCRTKNAEEILSIPDVQERTRRYFEQATLFEDMLAQNHTVHDNVVVIDLLEQQTIYSGNRFLVYGLYPQQNIEIRLMWGKGRQKVVFACGHSILNRTSKTNVGKLMLEYGGGGHEQVGTCQISPEDRERVLGEIVEQMVNDG